MTGALDGLRVLDFGQYIAGPLVAMMLGNHGADVVRVDPPGGPVWQHPGNAVLQRGKRSVVLDLHEESGRSTAGRLAESADVLIENFRPGVMERLGLGYADTSATNPGLIYCSLPGFGADDPRADVPGWEGVVQAAAGAYAPTWLNPGSEPAFSALTVSSNFAAFIAENCVTAALIARLRWGFGQRVEVPLFDATFEAIGMFGQQLPQEQALPMHAASNTDYECADGVWVRLVLIAPRHLRWFVERFLPPEAHEAEMADNAALAASPELAARLKQRIADLLRTRPAADWDRDVNAAGIPIAVHHPSAHWLRDDEQARAVGAVLRLHDPEYGDTVQAGFPVSMSATPPRVAGPRQPLGADNTDMVGNWSPSPSSREPRGVRLPDGDRTAGALAGMRVVDLTQVWAGPTAGRILAELGADVIKINAPDNWVLGQVLVNSGKRSALVDVTTPEGLEVVRALLPTTHVLMQNFAAGTAARLGLGEDDVREHRPDIVYASLSCYGYAGPRGGQRGWEPLGQTATGMMLRSGGDSPRAAPFAVCDYGSGHLLAFAILLGLYHRLHTGKGQHVQSSLVQAGTYHQVPWLIDFPGRAWDEPSGRAAHGWGPLDRMYRACDRSFYLAAGSDLHRLCSVEGLQDLAGRGGEGLGQELSARFSAAPAQTWVGRLLSAGVAAHVCRTVEEAMLDPEARRRGLSIVRQHPGIGAVRSIGPGARMTATPVRAGRPVGLPGADTAAVLRELGLADRLDQLVQQGAVAERLPPAAPLML
jgi:crotonobetainyl-CoA:carnitine CoA-transferase CaiB-like acyl-CoA transferase